MNRSEVLDWWEQELFRQRHGGKYCPCCAAELYRAINGGYVAPATWQVLIDRYFMPGTHWTAARDWLLEGCPSGAIRYHWGYDGGAA